MHECHYLHIKLKLQDDTNVVLTPAYFQGSIENSLRSIFGEIGGQTEIELIAFESHNKCAILQVPANFYVKTRTALALIGRFQDVPCHFQILRESREPLSLVS